MQSLEGEKLSVTIYLARHGETSWNTKDLMQGWQDSPLTNKGFMQAKRLAKRLMNISLHGIYSSTSGRAIHTAEIIKGDRALEVVKNDMLRELCFGQWEGKSFAENEKNNPREWATFWEAPHLFSSNTVEPFTKVQERMVAVIHSIAKQHDSENVCIVSHSIALKLLIAYIEKTPIEDLWSTPAIPPTSLTILRTDGTSYEILTKYNTAHEDGADLEPIS